MGQVTGIEWTHHTFNPWRGCTKVSAGCANCYAETMSGRNPGTLGVWGPNGTRVVAADSYWKQPVKWDREAAAAGERRRVFCASLADVFENWNGHITNAQGQTLFRCAQCGSKWAGDYQSNPVKPATRCVRFNEGCAAFGIELLMTMNDVRRRLFRLIDATPHLDWLLLTKRPENIGRMMPPSGVGDFHDRDDVCTLSLAPRPNVWLGTSVENQQTADERIPHLLRVPAAVRFLSCEPLLGAVQLNVLDTGTAESTCALTGQRSHAGFGGRPGYSHQQYDRGVDWVIVGGESGHGARPIHPQWVRSIRDQCQAAGVPLFFKQWGEYGLEQIGNVRYTSVPSGVPMDEPRGMFRVGKKAAGRMLDGREWSELPRDREPEKIEI